jgi:hypothetical protein
LIKKEKFLILSADQSSFWYGARSYTGTEAVATMATCRAGWQKSKSISQATYFVFDIGEIKECVGNKFRWKEYNPCIGFR